MIIKNDVLDRLGHGWDIFNTIASPKLIFHYQTLPDSCPNMVGFHEQFSLQHVKSQLKLRKTRYTIVQKKSHFQNMQRVQGGSPANRGSRAFGPILKKNGFETFSAQEWAFFEKVCFFILSALERAFFRSKIFKTIGLPWDFFLSRCTRNPYRDPLFN